ncbi:DUF6491 family protein [Thalassotalea crassostreae]|uniref:DUF6491 family protein n=1 Tax=Thalassotalea crassostreae TaxID=1763536 RepID=UPI00083854F9|nr:DUF6491 family protein [Thalassotalea crassostreae]
MIKKILPLIPIVLVLNACSTSTDNPPEKVDIRQGEEVNQICFTRELDNWDTIEDDNKALIVKDRNDVEYKLDLVGTCDLRNATFAIGTVAKGPRNCLGKGDKVITDIDTAIPANCTVMAIYLWHPEKLEVLTENATTEAEK